MFKYMINKQSSTETKNVYVQYKFLQNNEQEIKLNKWSVVIWSFRS